MKSKAFLVLLILVTVGGLALADSLSVTSTAAMGGVANAQCSGDGQPGPCGLEVFHDNSSRAFVEDTSPDQETIYRASFLFNPNELGQGLASGFRNPIFYGMNNRQPSMDCSSRTFTEGIKFFVWRRPGDVWQLQGSLQGNQCGFRSTLPRFIALDQDGPNKVCFEWTSGASDTGFLRFSVLNNGNETNACPGSAGPWDSERTNSNQKVNVDAARLGTVGTNNFGAGESGSIFFDEFQSFRTLAP